MIIYIYYKSHIIYIYNISHISWVKSSKLYPFVLPQEMLALKGLSEEVLRQLEPVPLQGTRWGPGSAS
jgi:Ni,Fe-hydrogenase I large subunit